MTKNKYFWHNDDANKDEDDGWFCDMDDLQEEKVLFPTFFLALFPSSPTFKLVQTVSVN